MSRPRVVVLGSSNTDMVIKLERIPRPGETILGGEFVVAPGGKGANQAVAAARAGGQVTFIARVGEDMFGQKAVAGFIEDGIDVSHIVRDGQSPSGVALIFVLWVLVIFGLFFGLLKYLAPFTDWARRWLEGIRAWWASLFGKANPDRKVGGGETATPQAALRPPPFSAYSNPFADGTAETRDPAELIAYTFEALDAWAHDRDAGRTPVQRDSLYNELRRW